MKTIISLSARAASPKMTLKEVLAEQEKLNARLAELSKLSEGFQKKAVSEDFKTAITYLKNAGYAASRNAKYSTPTNGDTLVINIGIKSSMNFRAAGLCRVRTLSGQVSWVFKIFDFKGRTVKEIPVRFTEPGIAAGVEKIVKAAQKISAADSKPEAGGGPVSRPPKPAYDSAKLAEKINRDFEAKVTEAEEEVEAINKVMPEGHKVKLVKSQFMGMKTVYAKVVGTSEKVGGMTISLDSGGKKFSVGVRPKGFRGGDEYWNDKKFQHKPLTTANLAAALKNNGFL